MQVYSGVSQAADARQALAEATQAWPKGFKPDLVLVFHSTRQDGPSLALELANRFPGVPLAGCSTSGEHLNGHHYNGSLVLAAIQSPDVSWTVAALEDIRNISADKVRPVADGMIKKLGLAREQLHPEKQFCLLFVDGLSLKEEAVAALVAEGLEGIPVLGGSAGDDLKFQKTTVLANGRSYLNAAVLVMAHSKVPFRVIKHQHFLKTPQQLVVTKVDTANRRVYELDGLPAAESYARAIGVSLDQLTADAAFSHPLMFRVNNEFYVRSVQKIEADGSIVFYCGVEEGMVLEVGGHEVMEAALARDLTSLKDQGQAKAELFIACNCILRALEATSAKKHEQLGQLLRDISPHIIGFDTYGEQLNGLHINQTLVGIALGRAA